MTTLATGGFAFLVFAAIWMTAVAIGTALGELVFTGSMTFGWVFIAISVALWGFVFWINPLQISIGMQ